MKKFILFTLAIFLSLGLAARDLKQIKESGVIYVAFTKSGKNTVNYIAAQEFANFLGVRLEIVDITWGDVFGKNGNLPEGYNTDPDVKYVPDALKKADIICGTIYIMDWRKKFFNYSGIVQVSDLLIVRKDVQKKYEKEVKSYQDLKGLKIAFLKNSSYETNLKAINKEIGGGINFVPTDSEDEAIKLLRSGKVDGLVAVSYLSLGYIKNSRQFKLAFPVATPKNVGWAVQVSNTNLKAEIENFYENIRGNDKLDNMFKNQYGIDYSTYIEVINSYAQANTSESTRDLDEILESGKIIIALRDREMVYHKGGKQQFNHHLAEEFANFLGVDLEIRYTEKFSNYFENKDGVIIKDSVYMPEWFKQFDVACDIIAPFDWRLKKVDIIDFIPNAKVVIGKKTTPINSVNDLRNLKAVTSEGSSYEHALLQNGISNIKYAQGNTFFTEVESGKVDYTISNVQVFNLSNYPDLEAKFILGEISKMGWAIKKNQPQLRQKILEFIEYAKKQDILDSHFKEQTGMTLKAAENYLTVLHESYQQGFFPFVFYGTEEDLPQEDILAVFQDKDRYIWFGTYAGAVKYDGRKMEVYNSEKGMANDAVYGINQDKAGNIYFATLEGISVLKPNTDTLINVVSDKVFSGVFVDKKQNKWCYGDDGITIITKSGKVKPIKGSPLSVHAISQDLRSGLTAIASSDGLFTIDKDDKIEQISKEYCHYAFFDIDSKLWVSTQSGLYMADKRDILSKRLGEKINKLLNISNIVVRNIHQTEDGSIWLTTDYNVLQILTLKQKPIVYDSSIGLKEYRILSFMQDYEDNLWFGFSGGVQKLTNKSLRTLFPDKLNSYVNSLFEDKAHRMWFGMNNDIYLFKDELVNVSEKLGIKSKSQVVTQNKDGDIIIATDRAIYIVDYKTLKIKQERTFSTALFHLEDIFSASNGSIYLLTGSTGIVYYLEDFNAEIIKNENYATRQIYKLEEFNGEIIGSNSSGLVLFKEESKSFWKYRETKTTAWTLKKGEFLNPATKEYEDVLWIGTASGLAYFKNDSVHYPEIEALGKYTINAIQTASDKSKIWLGTDIGVIYFDFDEHETLFTVNSKDGLLGNEIAADGLFMDGRELLWVGTYHGVAAFDIKKKKDEKIAPVSSIGSFLLNGDRIFNLPEILEYSQNNITFEISGLSFKDENSVVYEYYLQGLDDKYGAAIGKDKNRAIYTNLSPGKYSFKFRTKGKDGVWSYFQKVEFEILKPFYFEWWFIATGAAIFLLIGFLILKWRVQILKKRNEMLEQTIHERTVEVREKNVQLETRGEELLSMNEEIEKQKNAAEESRDEIAHQQKEIESSILYAKRIQNAILPPNAMIQKLLPQNFILFKPRDIVSGDYYWMAEKDNKVFFAAADCTGHGVPGAFMSMLGVSFLNDIVNTDEVLTSSMVLDRLRLKVIKALHQTGEVHEAKDGMDIALCILDREKLQLQFSGAFNPLYIVRDEEIIQVNADRMPIGIYEYDAEEKLFTTQNVDVKKGDGLYVFSDGYADQFGGRRGKKFMTGRFKKILIKIKDLPMEEQRLYLDNTIEKWRDGVSDQIDDILVIGVRV